MTAPAAPTPAAFRARTVGTLGRRRAVNKVMVGVIMALTVLATLPLVIIAFYLLKFGAGSVQWHFFTNMP
jgi:ABC-type phosphate transport system permease subunit